MTRLKTFFTVVITLAFWLVIYRLIAVIVYGIKCCPATGSELVDTVLAWLFTRSGNAPRLESRWLDYFLLVLSLLAAALCAVQATMSTGDKDAVLPASSSPCQPATANSDSK